MISKLPWKILTYTAQEGGAVIPVTSKLLNLKYSLLNGQAFNWYASPVEVPEQPQKETESLKPVPSNFIYQGVFRNYFVQFMTNDKDIINYRSIPEDDKLPEVLADYFQMSYNYPDLVAQWKQNDKYFSKMFKDISGIRILRQDPFECLIGFICSQNNNIPRITKLIYSLCEKYGSLILEIQGKKYYSFPTLDQLKATDEQTLRNMGFGYRAKYLVHTLRAIEEKGGEKWLLDLRGQDQDIIQKELTALMGIGKKVADCIALFSLDCKDAIPVDTHVHQIYCNAYKKGTKSSLTDKKYVEIGDFFREKFGEYAGWAHSYLFTTELNEFKEIKAATGTKKAVSTEEAKKVKVKITKQEKKITTEFTVKIKKVESVADEEKKESQQPAPTEKRKSLRKRKYNTEYETSDLSIQKGKEPTENIYPTRKQVKKNK